MDHESQIRQLVIFFERTTSEPLIAKQNLVQIAHLDTSCTQSLPPPKRFQKKSKMCQPKIMDSKTMTDVHEHLSIADKFSLKGRDDIDRQLMTDIEASRIVTSILRNSTQQCHFRNRIDESEYACDHTFLDMCSHQQWEICADLYII
jgi:hypothetical protein